ncbi:hypothetical protein [Amycolatopsis vastitatis]|uniref:hypothetical protein n=1 Tax=Amycolatopsis vastitatis TaxID=1905142 RepID=UPI001177CFED|nr:hypothetical protein [Amycolatopsis vastitatis]
MRLALESPPRPELPDVPATLVQASPHRQPEFAHDVLGEFFLATRIADLVLEHGRSISTVQALNEHDGRSAHHHGPSNAAAPALCEQAMWISSWL